MKTTCFRLLFAASAIAIAQTASATVHLTDDFTVSSAAGGGINDPNFEIDGGRQGGISAVSFYTQYSGPFGSGNQAQLGNAGTNVGQPDFPNNGNYLLLLQVGVANELDVAAAAQEGILKIAFDMYNQPDHGGEFGWFSLTYAGMQPSPDPNNGNGQFAMLKGSDGSMQVKDSTGRIDNDWNHAGFSTDSHFELTFTDIAGTGSAFNGNGSVVTIVNGAVTLGTFTLSQLDPSFLNVAFGAYWGELVGIDNLSITTTTVPEPTTVGYVALGAIGTVIMTLRARRVRRGVSQL